MILYFSGTGNTKFVAEFIADRIDDECVSINDVIKHKRPKIFKSDRPFVIAAPIYAGCFPRHVVKLIRQADMSGGEVWFIGTAGASAGKCAVELADLAAMKGLKYKGFRCIKMPNNYIVGGNVPDKQKAEDIIRKAIPRIEEIASEIAAGGDISKTSVSKLSNAVFGKLNSAMAGFMEKMNCADKFSVSNKCIGCGKCAFVCPVNNIIICSGRPIFREKCMNCLACINHCPTDAINYADKTDDVNRFVCPSYSDWKKKGML